MCCLFVHSIMNFSFGSVRHRPSSLRKLTCQTDYSTSYSMLFKLCYSSYVILAMLFYIPEIQNVIKVTLKTEYSHKSIANDWEPSWLSYWVSLKYSNGNKRFLLLKWTRSWRGESIYILLESHLPISVKGRLYFPLWRIIVISETRFWESNVYLHTFRKGKF